MKSALRYQKNIESKIRRNLRNRSIHLSKNQQSLHHRSYFESLSKTQDEYDVDLNPNQKSNSSLDGSGIHSSNVKLYFDNFTFPKILLQNC